MTTGVAGKPILRLKLAKVAQYLALVDDMIRVLHLCDVLLWKDLQYDLPFFLLVEGSDDFAEAARANLLEDVKISDDVFCGQVPDRLNRLPGAAISY